MKYFKVYELVSPETYIKFGEFAIHKFDPKILVTLDDLREYFKMPVTVNNWHRAIKDWNGDLLKQIKEYEDINKISLFKYRGYRPDTYENNGNSYHYMGMAIDCDVKGYLAEEVRQIILKNPGIFKYITRLENMNKKTNKPIDWVHLDIAKTDNSQIILFDV